MRLALGRQTLSNLENEKASVSIEGVLSTIEGLRLDLPRQDLGCNWPIDLARFRHLGQTIQIELIAAA